MIPDWVTHLCVMCCVSPDQVPPVLASPTRGQGVRAHAGEVSLGGMQPGVRDAAVHPDTHTGAHLSPLFHFFILELIFTAAPSSLPSFRLAFLPYQQETHSRSLSSKLLRLHVCTDMFHVWAICHVAELSAGSSFFYTHKHSVASA